MPDEPITTEEETQEEETSEETFDSNRAKDKIRRANAEAAGLRRRLKDLAEKAAKYDELEDANKSEQQKLADQVAAAEKRAIEAEAKALRYEVAAVKKLSPDLIEFLTGNTEEELEAQADKLLAFAVKFDDTEEQEDEGPPERQPRENLRPGRKGTTDLALNGDPLLNTLKQKLGVR